MNRLSFFVLLFTALSLPVPFGNGVWLFLKTPRFGAGAADGRLERIKKSPNFRNGEFENLLTTPLMTADNDSGNRRKSMFNRSKRAKPKGTIPSVKCDLRHLPVNQDFIVWFGHSSYFIQVDGKRLLVDPVLSGRASPVPFTVEAFNGTDRYTVADIPDVDYLFISHDLDYDTVKKLRSKVKKVICGLGVGGGSGAMGIFQRGHC